MVQLSGFGEGLLGFIGFCFAIALLYILVSLVGRLFNTTFKTRDGSEIQPFMTPKEIKDERRKNLLQKKIEILHEFVRLSGVDVERRVELEKRKIEADRRKEERRKENNTQADQYDELKKIFDMDNISGMLSSLHSSTPDFYFDSNGTRKFWSKIVNLDNTDYTIEKYNSLKDLYNQKVIDYATYKKSAEQLYILVTSKKVTDY